MIEEFWVQFDKFYPHTSALVIIKHSIISTTILLSQERYNWRRRKQL